MADTGIELPLDHYIDTVLSQVGSFEQNAQLTYPSVTDYKENLALVMNTILTGEKGITISCDFDADGIFSGINAWLAISNMYRVLRGEGAENLAKISFTDRQNSFGMTKEEYDSHIEESDLVITVDMGSDLPFLSEELKGKLVVLDHHPSKNRFSFVLNPNTGRPEGSEDYSTSGGRVVYDFCVNMDRAFRHHVPEYDKRFPVGSPDTPYSASRFYESLKVFAGITLVSDMAILDRENREFVEDALSIIKKDPERFHFFSSLSDITTRNLSFEIITLVNAMSRMEQDLHLVKDWIISSGNENYAEWEKLNEAIINNNTEKKKIVSKAFREFLATKMSDNGESLPVDLLFLEKQPIGILGLIANKVASAQNNKPTIVCGIKNDGNVVLSARGKDVKDTLTSIVEKSGGHQDACGGTIEVSENSTPHDEVKSLRGDLASYCEQNSHKFLDVYPTEVLTDRALSLPEFIKVRELFKDKANGVDFYKGIKVAVEDFAIIGNAEHTRLTKSGWANLYITDKNNPDPTDKDILSFWVDAQEYNLADFDKEDTVLIFDLTVNDDLSLFSITTKDALSRVTYLIEEAEVLDVRLEKPEVKSDVLLKPENSELIPTEREGVYLAEHYTPELVQSHPEAYFVFGDNLEGRGKGGQAIIRGYNSIGVPTKRAPSMSEGSFFSDQQDEQQAIIRSLSEVGIKYKEGYSIVFPLDGLGTGRAKMEEKSPKLFEMMNEIIGKNFTVEYRKFNQGKKIETKTEENQKETKEKRYNTKTRANAQKRNIKP